MKLPVRIVKALPQEPAICVDGAFGVGDPAAPPAARATLELSHWPGNTTPASLRHELSTGTALLFAALPREDRLALAGPARVIVNNHYDTDGTCALFAVRHPARALALGTPLLRAAKAGDFFVADDLDALRADLVIAGVADPERSPLRADLRELDDIARWQRATEHWMEHLDGLLRGEVSPYVGLFEEELSRHQEERSELERATRHLDTARALTVFVSPGAAHCGRHALFTAAGTDRVLALSPGPSGTEVRLLIGTRSWFDTTRAAWPARPSLESIRGALTRATGDPESSGWHAQPTESPSPELWFGTAGVPFFEARNAHLAPWPGTVEAVIETVRGAWPAD